MSHGDLDYRQVPKYGGMGSSHRHSKTLVRVTDVCVHLDTSLVCVIVRVLYLCVCVCVCVCVTHACVLCGQLWGGASRAHHRETSHFCEPEFGGRRCCGAFAMGERRTHHSGDDTFSSHIQSMPKNATHH